MNPIALHTPSRDTLVCLHSSGASGRQWDALATPLAAHFDLLTPHLLGYEAQALWPIGAPASLNDEAEQLLPLLHARPQGVHLFGHSYGASVALQIALRMPAQVKSLTLYEPVRFALLRGSSATAGHGHAVTAVGREIGRRVLRGQVFDAAALFVDYWSGAGSWAAMPARRQLALAQRMPKVQAEFVALSQDRVPLAAYRRLTMPVHLLQGEHSPAPARRVVDRLATQLPQAEVVVVPGAGHMAPVTQAELVAGYLPGWMRRAPLAMAA